MTTNLQISSTDKRLNLLLDILKQLLQQKSYKSIVQSLTSEELEILDILINVEALTVTDDGELIAAYPLSPIPTNYKIVVDEIGSGYAMCAIDALGVAFTFNKTVKIETIDSATNKVYHIIIDPTKETQERIPLYVHYKKLSSCCVAAFDQCPQIIFSSQSHSDITDDSITIYSFEDAIRYAKNRFSLDGLKKCVDKQECCEKS